MDSSDAAGFQPADTNPTPSTTAEVKEEIERLMCLLDDDQLRTIAACQLEGYRNAEIAKQLGTSKRTVERRLKLIRQIWDRELDR